MTDCLCNSFTLIDGESIKVPGYRNTRGEYHIPLSQDWHLGQGFSNHVSDLMTPFVVTAHTFIRRGSTRPYEAHRLQDRGRYRHSPAPPRSGRLIGERERKHEAQGRRVISPHTSHSDTRSDDLAQTRRPRAGARTRRRMRRRSRPASASAKALRMDPRMMLEERLLRLRCATVLSRMYIEANT